MGNGLAYHYGRVGRGDGVLLPKTKDLPSKEIGKKMKAKEKGVEGNLSGFGLQMRQMCIAIFASASNNK